MNVQETFQLYLALKLHFGTSSYDIFKYQGKIKRLPDINKRKDKYLIQKIAKHHDPKGLLIANLVKDYHIWTGDIISDKGLSVYKEWVRRQESLTYTFKEDIKKLKEGSLVENFRVKDGQHPLALRLYLGEHICLETLVIINSFTGFYSHWDKHLADDLVWKEIRLQIPKYTPFIKFERIEMKKILLENNK